MAQQFDVMQSLFGFAPADVQRQIGAEQQQTAMGLASGVPGGLGPAAFQAFRAQEQARGTPLFASQEDPRLQQAKVMQEARQAAQPAFEQGGLVGYLNQYANELEKRGLADKAIQARSVAAQKDKEAVVKTPADFALAGSSIGIPPKANAAAYTSEETTRIREKILADKLAEARASASKINVSDPGWQVKAVGEINSQTKENDTQLTYISQAVNTTINRRTPFDQKAFESLVGNVFGGKVKAQAEIERLKNSGTLGQRLDNTLNLFLQGKVEQATRDNQMEVLLSLYELSGKQRDAIVGQYKGILGAEGDKVALTTEQRHPLPPLTGNREYIPMSIVNQYNLAKGQKVKQGNKEFVYNGDGTITVLKKGK
jgi:hypothetical protein